METRKRICLKKTDFVELNSFNFVESSISASSYLDAEINSA
jgi:hypothetical protein